MQDLSVFAEFGMQAVNGASIDASLAQADNRLVCVFFWGEQCYNCDVAKKEMLARPDLIRALDLSWLQADVYADRELALRFGLHGIPVFMFFHRGKKLGRATGWHGYAQFEAAVANARRKAAGLPIA
ncbi:MAG TPA: thioredoxin family protein [Noviherbaspirillum sp.]|nr:thioredoxin family protein [Noviherbaspirillum sp.]